MKKNLFFLLAVIIMFAFGNLFSDELVRYNITNLDNPAPGYIFTTSNNGKYLAIYDNYGMPAYYKSLEKYGTSFNALRILNNGSFACFSSKMAGWLILDENFDVVDSAKSGYPYVTDFHTMQISPEGNYLVAGFDSKKVNMAEKVPAGKSNAVISNPILQEIDHQGNVVFQWNTYEHIDVLDATWDIPLTESSVDPYHINSAEYDSDGNILANFRNLDELIKINRATGEIMWVLGGCKSRKNQFTFINDTYQGFTGFSHQHNPKRLPNGNILLYDNGNLKPTPYSRAVEYQIDEIGKTATKVWEYRSSPDIFATFMGSAQRLANGNTIIGWGINYNLKDDLIATEVTPDGKIAFSMSKPNNGHYQTLRYIYRMKAVSKDISSDGIYDFNENQNQTDVSLNLNKLSGRGFTSVEKHSYAPFNINSSINTCSYLPFRWVINNNGVTSFSGKLYLNLASFSNYQNKQNLKIYLRSKENYGFFTEIKTVYNSQLDRLEADISSFGEFVIAYPFAAAPTLGVNDIDTANAPVFQKLKWTSDFNDINYRFQLSTTDDFNNLILDTTVATNSCNIYNLEHFTKYFWRVRTEARICNGGWSDIASFKTMVSTPDLIYPLSRSKALDLSDTLKWGATDNADSYHIQITDDSTFRTLLIDQTVKYSTVFKFKSLKLKTNYFWRVSAGNNKLFGDWSEINTFSTTIGKINLLSPNNFSTGNNSKGFLAWEKMNNGKEFNVQISKDSTFTKILIDSLISKSEKYYYKNLEHLTNYFWRVQAFDGDFESGWSDIWSFRTNLINPTLDKPSNNVENLSLKGILLWKPVEKAEIYEVQLSADSTFSTFVINQKTFKTSLSYANLGFDTKYYWRVRAYDQIDAGEWSETHTFSTQSKTDLISPTLIYPPNGEFGIPVKLEFVWDESYSAVSYELQLAEDSQFTVNLRNFPDLKDTKFSFNDLLNNKTYYIRLRSINPNMTSEWSAYSVFTTALTAPVPVNPLSQLSTKNVNFNWENVEGANSYRIQIANDRDFQKLIVDSAGLISNIFNFSGFSNYNSDYYWRVGAFSSNNSSEWSAVAKFSLLLSSVFDDVSSTFYATPSITNNETEVTFFLDEPSEVDFEIRDLKGYVVKKLNTQLFMAGQNKQNIQLSDLPQGTYFLEVKFKNTQKLLRIVIVK